MRILLTGATGYIGSAVLAELVGAGHDVVAAVRSERAADEARAHGATAVVGELMDAAWLASQLAGVDAAIHTAAPATDAAAFDTAIVDAVLAAFDGTGRRYVHTGGIWAYGAGDDLADDATPNPPELVAWRVPIEERLLAASGSVTVIVPGVVYGRDRGLASLVVDAPRDDAGRVELVGDGDQHWTWVHVDDLARLYRLAVEHETGLGRLIASDGSPTTVRTLAEAVVARGDATGVVAEGAERSRARLGATFADALLLDQRASGAKARALGWTPVHGNVVAELVGDEASAA
ncbi:NAD-dependent epimerase/dehydratase family protein [Agromyces endophyticus]|uniref:NAD-dependent epimerase/dehydratase family protein n=1 Tax=Agromyces sp. H17E-10 TaxID=2932244 RepID=UPI001FD053C8|nr:NAD-dependent epimerase/dehydratase family protein [Agromyces sp. H17E-10]UOQ90387.1 NAD-dependent epimerase/dehydratase family protein [Agromyces sp. H17E-10]